MEVCQGESGGVPCGENDLAARLAATYGEPIGLRAEAAGRLHGPFGSDEWPTATIVLASGDGPPSMLVADRGDTVACCVMYRPPQDSGLNFFPLEVGGYFLAEVTPAAEPQILGYFE
jgi:hypothetical protein